MNIGCAKALDLLPFDQRHAGVERRFKLEPPLAAEQTGRVCDSKLLIEEGFVAATGKGLLRPVGGGRRAAFSWRSNSVPTSRATRASAASSSRCPTNKASRGNSTSNTAPISRTTSKTSIPPLKVLRSATNANASARPREATVATGLPASVSTPSGWFAARPSGTKNTDKIYAERFVGAEHLQRILQDAQGIVAAATSQAPAPKSQ